MNREIKFRAYSNATKKMMDWDFIKSVGNLNKLISLNHADLMQYIGLKDVHCKDIYEGDIVRWGMLNDRSRECWHRYAVVEINPDIQFRILYYIVANTGEKKETDGHIFHYGNFAYKETKNHLEIIGNIYENT